MKIEYDRVADAMYMRYTNEPVTETREASEWIVDFDISGNLVGIEILWVKNVFSENNISLKQKTTTV